MEPQTPQWLTTEFLEKSLGKVEKYKGMSVMKLTTSPAVSAGNNYGSTVLRVTVDYRTKESEETQKLSLILKAPLTEGFMKNLIESTDCEPEYYYRFLPKAYKKLNHHFAPECYPSINPVVVILEDLKEKGFMMAERTKQLDFEHCKLYIKAAASFHSMSYAMIKDNPDVLKSFKAYNMFDNESNFGPVNKNMTIYGLKCVAAHVTNQKHSKVLLSCVDTLWDILVDIQKPSSNFNCFRQGDPFITNMMFKYDDSGNVIDIKLIDFQNLIYGSMVHDLVFFIWTSANAEVRKCKINDLYKLYFESFNENLKAMGISEQMCYENFTKEVEKLNPMVLWVLSITPCSTNPSAVDYNLLFSKLDPKNGELSVNPFEEFFIDNYCQNILPQYIEHLELAGVFDYFGSMQSDVPKWITNDFLTGCLETEDEFRNIIIESFTVSAAVPPGNNYASNILQINLQVTKEDQKEDKKSLSLIIKAPLTTGTMCEMFDTLKDSEPLFYNEFLPYSYKLITHSFAPKSFKSPLPSVVVLEDLKLQNFSMADRLKQLDFEHCQLYMKAAASFHAVSFALHKENPNLINRIGAQKMFDNNLKGNKLSENLNKYALQSMADHIKSEKQAEIVRKCSTRMWNMLVEGHKPRGSFNCLTQGDPWTTNMMFKYDEDGKVCDIKLLDFQNVAFGSPIHDIVFFMWSSANHDVRKHRLNELYSIYLDALNKNLKCLNFPEALLFETFMDEVKKTSSVVLWVLGWVPCMLTDIPADLEGMVSAVNEAGDSLEVSPYDKYYTESYCENHLVRLLDELETHGVFQYLAEQLKDNH